MIRGYIMVECEVGREQTLYQHLTELPWVLEVHPLFGEYDFILKVEAKDPNELAKEVIDELRAMEGVLDTKTFLEASFGPDDMK